MIKIFAAAAFTLAALAVAGFSSGKHSFINCDGYGTHCAYPVNYPGESFKRNAIEQDTARRAAEALANLSDAPVKFQDRLASK